MALISDQPAHIIFRGKLFPFMRQEIIKTTPIPDIPKEKPSFFGKVNDTPSGSSSFRELYVNLSDYACTITSMRSGLLTMEPMLVFLYTKFNIAPSSTTTELYSKDAVLMTMIL